MKKKEYKKVLIEVNERIEDQEAEIVAIGVAIDKLDALYSKQITIAENEIKRLNVIINYLEMREYDTMSK